MLVLSILACSAAVPIADGLVFAAFPPCERLPSASSLDLTKGCAVGVCADMSYAGFVAVLGEPAGCSASTKCEWDEGVYGYFDELDGGGVDPDSVASALYMTDGFAGSDESGLGIGVSLGCFIEVLGEPEAVDAELQAGEYYVDELDFSDRGINVRSDDTLDGLTALIRLEEG